MAGAGIEEGNTRLIERALDPQPGAVVVAVVDREFTVKRFPIQTPTSLPALVLVPWFVDLARCRVFESVGPDAAFIGVTGVPCGHRKVDCAPVNSPCRPQCAGSVPRSGRVSSTDL